MSNQFKEIDGGRYKIVDPSIINESPDVCFLVEGKHYRLSKGGIAYDYIKKVYVLKTSIEVENGFVGIDKDDNPILGGWSWPKEHLLEDAIIANFKGQAFFCISEEIFEGSNWEERLFDGEFYPKGDLPVKEFSKIKSVPREVKNTLPYNASEELKKASKIYSARFDPKVYDKGVASYPQVLGGYTYGFEFETTKGIIPNRICNKLGLIPLRDGSIDGIEYATIPLAGKNGIQTIIESCAELEKRTTFNDDCSLHIHIGGMPRTETFFIALTKILCNVQEEMYEMFPFYTRGGFNLKKKDYTAPLPAVELMTRINSSIDKKSSADVNANFQHVFEFLSMGHKYTDYGCNLKNVLSHPSDPGGTSKWYVKSRYRWVNMIPLLFGNKKTIEFRIHTPTYDPNKIIFFAIMCASIIDAATRQEKAILEGTLQHYRISDFVYSYLSQFGDKYSHVHNLVHRYIYSRRDYTIRSIRDKDFYGNEAKFISPQNLYSTVTNKYGYLVGDGLKQTIQEEMDRDEPPHIHYGGSRTRAGRSSGFFDAANTFNTYSPPVHWGSPSSRPIRNQTVAIEREEVADDEQTIDIAMEGLPTSDMLRRLQMDMESEDREHR